MYLEQTVSEGRKVLYTGPMCASKSLQLIHHYSQLQSLDQRIYAFVHKDNDSLKPNIVSRLQAADEMICVPALEVGSAKEILLTVETDLMKLSDSTLDSSFLWEEGLIHHLEKKGELVSYQGRMRWNPQFYVLIDELNFFDSEIKTVIEKLAYDGVHVFVGGLEHDFRRELFSLQGGLTVSEIAGIVDEHHKLTALCQYQVKKEMYCGAQAVYTLRFRDELHIEPSYYDDPLFIPNKKLYIPVCRDHHLIKGRFK